VHPLDWQTEQPVPLLRNVQRLTAPNPGVMTGPGTNSYLVGDPAPATSPSTPARPTPSTWTGCGARPAGDIRMIVCTHSHPDHSPGARPLQALCEPAPTHPGPALAPTRARPASSRPTALQNNELLALSGCPAARANHPPCRCCTPPGHAANHLCLVLLEDGLLFSGDHILNGSTTVIDPPDGDMTAYLDSLDRCAPPAKRTDRVHPARARLCAGRCADAIGRLKAHRLKREARIIAAMREQPEGTLDDWVASAYDDVPPRMWPVAARSLLAHSGSGAKTSPSIPRRA
jgi:recombination protein RecT